MHYFIKGFQLLAFILAVNLPVALADLNPYGCNCTSNGKYKPGSVKLVNGKCVGLFCAESKLCTQRDRKWEYATLIPIDFQNASSDELRQNIEAYYSANNHSTSDPAFDWTMYQYTTAGNENFVGFWTEIQVRMEYCSGNIF